jgi:hypothetical protein
MSRPALAALLALGCTAKTLDARDERDLLEDEAADDDTVEPIACGDATRACGDGEDNDGDGLVDADDPECTGPCDGDEASLSFGPSPDTDCRQDCYFDDNAGQGDDACFVDLGCDPAGAGAAFGCSHDADACADPPPIDPACVAACAPLTPPGCDCFGCCTLELADGDRVDVFLGSGSDCRLDALDACLGCTSRRDVCPGT